MGKGGVTMRKRIIVILLSACLLLAAGCSETQPPIDVSEPGEPQNNSAAQEPKIGQEQSSLSIPAADSRPIISANVFLEDSSHLQIIRRHFPSYGLSYQDAKKFLLGIDFSQLEPLEGNYEEFLDFSGYDIVGEWKGIEGHVHHRLRFRLPTHRLAYAIAIHSVSETYLDESGDFQFNTRYYFYSISPEFYFDMRDRFEEFAQYGIGMGGVYIPIEWLEPTIDMSTFFEDLDRINIDFPDGTPFGNDFRSRELWLSYENVEEFLSGIDFSRLEPIEESDERYNFDALANLASFSATGIRMSGRDGSLWLSMRWGYGYEGVAVFNMRWNHTDEGEDVFSIAGARSFYSISQEFYNAVFDRVEEFWQAQMDARN